MGSACFRMNAVALALREAESVAAALQVQEQLGAVRVVPLARVHGAPPQSYDDRQVLDSHRALVFARAAGGALKRRLHGQVLAQENLLALGSEFVQVAAGAEDDFLRVEDLAGKVRGTVLGAAPAFHAGVSLEAGDARDVFAGDEAEVLVARERRDLTEAAPAQEHRDGAEDQVEVLGARDDRQKDQQRQGMEPPVGARGGRTLRQPELGQVGHHQHEDQKRDQARLIRDFPQPLGPHDEPPGGQPHDRHCHGHREDRREADGQQLPAERFGHMVHRDQRERAKPPEDEGVRQTGPRPLADHLRLEQNFPDELPYSGQKGSKLEIGVRFRAANQPQHAQEPPAEQEDRHRQQEQEHPSLQPAQPHRSLAQNIAR